MDKYEFQKRLDNIVCELHSARTDRSLNRSIYWSSMLSLLCSEYGHEILQEVATVTQLVAQEAITQSQLKEKLS